MTLNIREFSLDMAEKWDEYVYSTPKATFCHLIGWKNVVEKTFGHRSFYLYAEIDNQICGILPLFLVKSFLFGKILISSPLAVYGGICADNQEVENLLLTRAKEIADNLKVDYLELRNIEANGFQLPTKDLYVTFFQELFNEDTEKNLKIMPREARRLIRKANKAGLKAIIEQEDVEQFYDVYSRNLRDLGTPAFPIELFYNFMEEFFPDNCNILQVVYGDKVIASVLVFYFKDRVMPYYGAALKEYNNNKFAPSNFMYWELMKYGIENGYKIFDFGRSKVDTGPYNFKRHFGMNPTPLHYQYYLVEKKELPNLNPINSKFQFLINRWKKLPLGIANRLGPYIVKYIP